MTSKRITLTAEQFAVRVQKHRIDYPEETERKAHVDAVLESDFPDIDRHIVMEALVNNTVAKKLDQQDRDMQREVGKWVDTGQLDLFGGVKGPKLPEFMVIGRTKKHYTETTLTESREVLAGLSAQVESEMDELAKAWTGKKGKRDEIADSMSVIEKLIELAEQSGFDPSALTYEEAKSNSFEIIPRTETGDGDSARR
jgi:hypothetical protein